MIPILFTTYNRLEFTKLALEALLKAEGIRICIFDNASTDGTRKYLENEFSKSNVDYVQSHSNVGIAGAMNNFINKFGRKYPICGKVDNDTIVKPDFAIKLREKLLKCGLDIIQAKHPILKETHPGGFDAWMKTMNRDHVDKSVYRSSFVGGSGILFKTSIIKAIPQTEWKLYGWRQFQKDNPTLKKAFTTDVEIELLDMNKEGGSNYPKEYQNYYQETRRA